MKQKLTKSLIDNLKPTERTYKVWDTEVKGLFVRVSPIGTKTFAIFYRHTGKGRDFNIGRYGVITLHQARNHAITALGRVAAGYDVLAEKKTETERARNSASKTLGGFINDKYKSWIEANHKSSTQTLEMINASFGNLYDKNLTDISSWVIQKWCTEKLRAGTKKTTVNRRVAALKALLNKAVDWEVIDENPINSFKLLKTDNNRVIRYLTQQELQRLYNALDKRQIDQRAERDRYNLWLAARNKKSLDTLDFYFTDYLKPIVLIALNTGLRRGEIFSLHWSDINLVTKTLTVNGYDAKNLQTRHVPLNNEAYKTLLEWKKQSVNNLLVFPSPITNQKLTNIKSAWKKLLQIANINNFRFHDLRHHFASSLVMRSADLNIVRELLGHSSLQMTLRYAHLAPAHKAAAVALLNSTNHN